VERETARVTVISDPFPDRLAGIPLDLRAIVVDLDKPRFARNPTSCDPLAVDGVLVSTLGQSAGLGNRFQLGECDGLRFKPKLSLRFSGDVHRGGHPMLRTVVKMPPGGANLARAAVTLPLAAFVDQDHIRALCNPARFAADRCPGASVYGRARAFSPLLGHALAGPVYLRSSDGPLPDLVARLRGPDNQPIEIDLTARTEADHGALRISFGLLPDAPVNRLQLELFGGQRGLIELSTDDYCSEEHHAQGTFVGQNGRRRTLHPVVRNPRCSR
jgi:hypothetical protein